MCITIWYISSALIVLLSKKHILSELGHHLLPELQALSKVTQPIKQILTLHGTHWGADQWSKPAIILLTNKTTEQSTTQLTSIAFALPGAIWGVQDQHLVSILWEFGHCTPACAHNPQNRACEKRYRIQGPAADAGAFYQHNLQISRTAKALKSTSDEVTFWWCIASYALRSHYDICKHYILKSCCVQRGFQCEDFVWIYINIPCILLSPA